MPISIYEPVNFVFNCTVKRAMFEQQYGNVQYPVGSGSMKVKLPELIQIPDCKNKLKKLKIKQVFSTYGLTKETILSTVSLDEEGWKLVVASEN